MKRKSVLFLAAFIVSLLFLASCDDGSGNSGSSSASTIAPPSWIQGTWRDSSLNEYSFTSNNIIDYLIGDYATYQNAGILDFEEIENSDTVYKFTVTITSLGSETYTYTKVDSSHITLEYSSTSLSLTNL